MKALGRLLLLVLCATLLLQLFFVARIAVMAWLDPESTSYQRSEAWQLVRSSEGLRWRQQWVDYGQISSNLKRAVIASEDAGFMDHHGVEWDAVQRAWQRNAKAEARAMQAEKAGNNSKPAKVYGGSTITQQLAKNLLLSGERNFLRKGQELVLAQLLELMLSKQRILEIYLNNVEWGQGVFGAEAAAQHYFRKSAAQLNAAEAARLAAMLPAPKRFEKMPQSRYLAQRSRTIARYIPMVTPP
ncbi:monofunctional biosynthetic peptidoglycan transglycosylase [Comamonas sp. NyZ500]|uniref:monofunctional biosynthetic peptidoglycan transglycosylase n=1 Tax=Comamonas sp. NyZ500 TaxID=2795732 RepID=UPI00192C2F6C|nr:monofunctional biosynthetic peptidoglycan transglycosylase [Comamonas sp. NyZ500]MBL5980168.1 monofunctional biosynthetic peptidoglycan transglycosylase [Comamonas sp. NyZ500]